MLAAIALFYLVTRNFRERRLNDDVILRPTAPRLELLVHLPFIHHLLSRHSHHRRAPLRRAAAAMELSPADALAVSTRIRLAVCVAVNSGGKEQPAAHGGWGSCRASR